ncbi:MAG: GNAT family N-acetyltransferase [Deltaproteobacteria bacterium]|nr:GNAT family N-acetyltransferase [Deltaproteobacteria bacterium]
MRLPADLRASALAPLALDGPRLRALPASAAHARHLQACLDGAPGYFLATEGTLPGPDAAERLLSDAEADAQRLLFLLAPRAGGAPVGLLDLQLEYPEPDTAQIVLLLFRERCQGQGYGRETTAALEAALAARGVRALRLSVVDENTGAHAFWERVGFAAVGRLERGVTVYEKVL